MRKPALSINAQISIGATSSQMYIVRIREDFLNTKYLTIYMYQPVTVQLLESVSLIDNECTCKEDWYLILRHPHENDVCISVYGVQLYLGLGKKCLLQRNNDGETSD